MPNIQDRTLLFVDGSVRAKRRVAQFDVVLLRDTSTGKRIIKRVVGLPGEEVLVENERLFVNAEPVEEPFSTLGVLNGNFFWVLGKDEFVVLGDNRELSTDSRKLGPVRGDAIEGVILKRRCR